MITSARESKLPIPDGYWGKVEGMIRAIVPYSNSSPAEYAIYLIEESPGYREIRFNRRKYRIFFPWVYFFVRVMRSCETRGTKLCVFVSKTQMKDMDDPCLLLAPFPSSTGDGKICMPDGHNKQPTPIETALDVIVEFWKSNSTELIEEVHHMVPDQLTKGKSIDKIGAIYGAWSRLTPNVAMNMEFEKPKFPSAVEFFKGTTKWDS